MKQQAGFSLVELLLVFVIMASLIVLGLRFYYYLQVDKDMRQVQVNVDNIFQAMSDYYRINCYGTVNANQTIKPGTLNPKAIPAPGLNYSINIQTNLITPGLLGKTALVRTSIVNAAGAGTKGYIAQFNEHAITRKICTGGAGAFGTSPPQCTSSANVGTVISWQAQVAVQLNKPAQSATLISMLGADCRSNLVGKFVTSCQLGSGSGNYIVWERTLSNASLKGGSTYWGSMPVVTQFKQMYTTYPMPTVINGQNTANQNYLCGN